MSISSPKRHCSKWSQVPVELGVLCLLLAVSCCRCSSQIYPSSASVIGKGIKCSHTSILDREQGLVDGMVEEHGRVQVRQILLAGLLSLLLLAAAMMLVPNYTLAWVRSELPWLSHLISRVEMLWPGVNTVHVLAFAMLGLVTRLAFPRLRLSLIILAYLTFSVFAELLQFYIPGRTPMVTDVRDNMAGLALGLVAAIVLCWLWRWASRRGVAG